MKKVYCLFWYLHFRAFKSSLWPYAGLFFFLSFAFIASAQEREQNGEDVTISNRKANARTLTINSRLNAARVSSYVEVGNGLTYQDDLGQWHDSEDLIEIMEDGTAAALKGPNKVRFQANLNTADAVSVTTSSNRVFRTRILGLYYFDPVSGKSALVAPVQDCSGILLPPNQVLYENAFRGVRADVRMTYTRGAFENDVILLEKPVPPEEFGLSESSRLEIWHEFKAPAGPKSVAKVLKLETDPILRARMSEPDLVDHTLDFGDLWFPQGRAFNWETETNPTAGAAARIELANAANTNDLRVAKQWIHFDQTDTDLLIESVNWKDLSARIETMPQAKKVASATELKDRVKIGRVLSSNRAVAQLDRKHNVTLASAAYQPKGYIFDYITVFPVGNFEFQSGVTYYVTGGFYNGGTMTFQPGCVVKMTNGASLQQYGSLVCNGTTNSPSILTSMHDDLYGERIAGSTGNPGYTASYALYSYAPATSPQIKGLKIRWAQTAYHCDPAGDYGTVIFKDSSLEQCNTGLDVPGYWAFGCVSIQNSTVCNVQTPAYDGGAGYAFTGAFVDACNGDSDSDGLPDAWEITHFGNTTHNATEDADGDGLTNAQEYFAGSNPSLKVWIMNPSAWGSLP